MQHFHHVPLQWNVLYLWYFPLHLNTDAIIVKQTWHLLILLIDSANEFPSASLEGVLCSMCKHLKAVYLWTPNLLSGGSWKSPMMLSERVGGGRCALKALCSESWTYSFCFGNARWGRQFVYISRRQNRTEERKRALVRKKLTTSLFIHPLKFDPGEKVLHDQLKAAEENIFFTEV